MYLKHYSTDLPINNERVFLTCEKFVSVFLAQIQIIKNDTNMHTCCNITLEAAIKPHYQRMVLRDIEINMCLKEGKEFLILNIVL